MKVLVAIDTSRSSPGVLRALTAQFPPRSTDVKILHVLQPIAVSAPPQMSTGYAPELQDEGQKARALVDRVTSELRAAGFAANGAVEQGDVREKIVDVAASWHADLVLVGSRGTGALRRLLLGSVAEYVARHAPCSVQIVRDAGSNAP